MQNFDFCNLEQFCHQLGIDCGLAAKLIDMILHASTGADFNDTLRGLVGLPAAFVCSDMYIMPVELVDSIITLAEVTPSRYWYYKRLIAEQAAASQYVISCSMLQQICMWTTANIDPARVLGLIYRTHGNRSFKDYTRWPLEFIRAPADSVLIRINKYVSGACAWPCAEYRPAGEFGLGVSVMCAGNYKIVFKEHNGVIAPIAILHQYRLNNYYGFDLNLTCIEDDGGVSANKTSGAKLSRYVDIHGITHFHPMWERRCEKPFIINSYSLTNPLAPIKCKCGGYVPVAYLASKSYKRLASSLFSYIPESWGRGLLMCSAMDFPWDLWGETDGRVCSECLHRQELATREDIGHHRLYEAAKKYISCFMREDPLTNLYNYKLMSTADQTAGLRHAYGLEYMTDTLQIATSEELHSRIAGYIPYQIIQQMVSQTRRQVVYYATGPENPVAAGCNQRVQGRGQSEQRGRRKRQTNYLAPRKQTYPNRRVSGRSHARCGKYGGR